MVDRTAHDEAGEQERRLLERATFFSDAVFAIAMTLLVIEVRLPEHLAFGDAALGRALLDLIPNYIAFVSSFLVIARFWHAHHQLFGMLARIDGRTIWLNLFLLLAVAFLPFPTAVLARYAELRVGACFYAGWLTLIGAVQVLLTRRALRGRRLVRPEESDADVQWRLAGSAIPVAIGATAFAVALVQPLWSIVALAVGSPFWSWFFHRRRRAPVTPA